MSRAATSTAARKIASAPSPAPAVAGDKYYQGKPCRNGHDGLRYLSTKGCVLCARAHSIATKAKLKLVASTPAPAVRPTTAAAA